MVHEGGWRMRRARVSRGSRRLLAGVVLASLLEGCGSFQGDVKFGPRRGFRPDDPKFEMSATACDALKKYVIYAENLKEAYRTRAAQNRTWIYVAAIGGLGVAAASGALAAATAVAAGTLALLAISGGFTSAAFATIDNSELANVYTVAANNIDTAMGNVQARISRCRGNENECAGQLAYPTTVVAGARDSPDAPPDPTAAGGLAPARAQKNPLPQAETQQRGGAHARGRAPQGK